MHITRGTVHKQSDTHSASIQSYTLGPAIRMQWLPLALGIVVLALCYSQIIPSMVRDWYFDDNASHGFFIPLISLYIVWMRRSELATSPVDSSKIGLFLIAASVIMLVAGWLAFELFTMRLSLVIALCGCVLYWFGKRVFSLLASALLFLVYMIPLPAIVYNAVAFPLKLFVSWLSVGILQAMGMMVVREGNIIMFPNITLEVVDACSGLRSLTALFALSTAYALILIRSPRHRIILVASTLPIAVGANVLRVTVTGVLARKFGAAAAEGFFHEFTGLVTFVLALAALAGLHQVLRRFK